jgi:hypothetical protein
VARLAVRLGKGAGADPPTPPTATAEPFDWDASPSIAGWPISAACSSPAARSASPAAGPTSSSSSRRGGARPRRAPRARGLPAAWRLRRGRGVVTWKNADTVGLFLRRIGAGGALLELEARQVARALRGDLNRSSTRSRPTSSGPSGRPAASSRRSRSSTRTAGSPSSRRSSVSSPTPGERPRSDARRARGATPDPPLDCPAGPRADRAPGPHPDEGVGRRTRPVRRRRVEAREALA